MEEIRLYTDQDMNCAAVRLRRCVCLLACLLLPLLAVYVLAVLKGLRLLMLAALLAGFVCIVFCGEMYLLPAWRYVSFLKEMKKGLRRSADCVLKDVSAEVKKQDGARVHAVQVRLTDGMESRIFYLDVSKRDLLPPVQTRIKISSYGRHIVSYTLL